MNITQTCTIVECFLSTEILRDHINSITNDIDQTIPKDKKVWEALDRIRDMMDNCIEEFNSIKKLL